MRRAFPFSLPTLILCFFIQCLGSFLPCMFNLLTAYALAQAPITPSGLNTQVSPPVTIPGGQTQYDITGGTRPGNGPNLFHSFGEFGVPTNNIANFLNDTALTHLQYPRSRHRRQSVEHLRDHSNHRLRQRQSVLDEPGRDRVRAECVIECRRIGHLHNG